MAIYDQGRLDRLILFLLVILPMFSMDFHHFIDQMVNLWTTIHLLLIFDRKTQIVKAGFGMEVMLREKNRPAWRK